LIESGQALSGSGFTDSLKAGVQYPWRCGCFALSWKRHKHACGSQTSTIAQFNTPKEGKQKFDDRGLIAAGVPVQELLRQVPLLCGTRIGWT
jgi:hypothetical protein